MLKKIPELDFEDKKLKGKTMVDEDQRMKVCFDCGKTSFYLNLLFRHLNATIEEKTGSSPKSFDALAAALDQNHGCLDMDAENAFQAELKNILKVEDMMKYYETLGLK